MNIGISTSCFYPLYTEKSLLEVAKSGTKLTEIFFNSDGELEKGFVKQLTDIKNAYGLTVKSVHPACSLAESYNLFSSYERRYDETMERYKRYAEIVTEMGGKYIILHGGKPNDVLDNRGYYERFYKIYETLKREGAVLLQENVVKFRAGNLDVLKEMAEYLGDEAGFCLDIKQSLRGGYSPFDVLTSLKGKIKHIHLSDNTDKKDCLLPLNGNFDFVKFFKTAKECGYEGDGIIEVYSYCYENYSEIFASKSALQEKCKNL